MKFSFLKKKEEQSGEYAEIPQEERAEGSIKIMVEKLEKSGDADKVIKKVREGNIVFVRIKELKETNMDELKFAVNKIKTSCLNSQGDVAGVSDEWLIVAPCSAEIVRNAGGA